MCTALGTWRSMSTINHLSCFLQALITIERKRFALRREDQFSHHFSEVCLSRHHPWIVVSQSGALSKINTVIAGPKLLYSGKLPREKNFKVLWLSLWNLGVWHLLKAQQAKFFSCEFPTMRYNILVCVQFYNYTLNKAHQIQLPIRHISLFSLTLFLWRYILLTSSMMLVH